MNEENIIDDVVKYMEEQGPTPTDHYTLQNTAYQYLHPLGPDEEKAQPIVAKIRPAPKGFPA